MINDTEHLFICIVAIVYLISIQLLPIFNEDLYVLDIQILCWLYYTVNALNNSSEYRISICINIYVSFLRRRHHVEWILEISFCCKTEKLPEFYKICQKCGCQSYWVNLLFNFKSANAGMWTCTAGWLLGALIHQDPQCQVDLVLDHLPNTCKSRNLMASHKLLNHLAFQLWGLPRLDSWKDWQGI